MLQTATSTPPFRACDAATVPASVEISSGYQEPFVLSWMIHHTALQAKTLNVRRSALEPMGVLARVSDIEDCARRGYFADPEYNRKQHGHVKTILSANMEVINITCDLIVHSRGRVIQNDNMIAIEMAKPNKTAADILADRSRLRALTKSSYDGVWSYGDGAHPEHVCGYVMGLFIMVDRINRVVQTELFRSGEKVSRFDDLPF